MARVCSVCGKRPQISFNVSHAHNRTKRWVYPNVHKMRFILVGDAKARVHNDKVCTKCVKAQKIQKVF
ncbi:MAG: 50S ribosomal protein L28 [candidate division TM6 bacterium GW2011_GWE2_41_16]|nr:MAG: 50S ribosomal protein L28 [candidate division TM6 bacterium GW2011_GWE2_41_16]